jgi:hypothetical protein
MHHHRPHSDRFGLSEDIFGMRSVALAPIVKPTIALPPSIPAINYAAMVDTLQAEVSRLSTELKRVNLLVFESRKLSAELTVAKAGLTAANALLQTDLKTCAEELAATKMSLAEVTQNYQNGLATISELQASNLLSTEQAAAAYNELNTTLTAQITALQTELEASKLLAADAVAQMAAAEARHAEQLKQSTKKTSVVPIALAAAAAYFAFNS